MHVWKMTIFCVQYVYLPLLTRESEVYSCRCLRNGTRKTKTEEKKTANILLKLQFALVQCTFDAAHIYYTESDQTHIAPHHILIMNVNGNYICWAWLVCVCAQFASYLSKWIVINLSKMIDIVYFGMHFVYVWCIVC